MTALLGEGARIGGRPHVPLYRLKCALRFKTGHAGVAFDDVTLAADSPAEAIALAEMYRCATPGMDLSVAVLLDEVGAPIWSRRAPSAMVRGKGGVRVFSADR